MPCLHQMLCATKCEKLSGTVTSLGRHVHREFMRNALLDVTPIVPATAYDQSNDVETSRRCKAADLFASLHLRDL